MKQKNYYKILGIDKNATTDDIKKAYRKLVHKCHPDIVGNTAENIERFKEVTEAYETLSSPQKREQYDSINRLYEFAEGEVNNKAGANDAEIKHTRHSEGRSTEESKNKKTSERNKEKTSEDKNKEPEQKRENTFSKMREQAKSSHETNIFTSFVQSIINKGKPKGQKKYTPPKVDGKDITTEVTLSIEEAINGTERVVNILHMETCEKCRGRKFINGAICPECGGKGEKSKYKKLTVKIPPKVKQGSKIRLEGQGNKGYNGGKRGNLYLIIKIENNADLQYDGLNVMRTVTIEPYEAVLGGFINIDINGSKLQMKIMPNTYNGQKYRISEQGAEKDGKKGDLIITVKIDIPKHLSKEEISLYEKLKLASKRNIRE